MKLRSVRPQALLVLLVLAGCERSETSQTAAAPAPTPAPTPAPATPVAPSTGTVLPSTGLGSVVSDVWYRRLHDGQAEGWQHVTWTRSSFEGKPTIHDRTEGYSASTRQMGGMVNVFETRVVTETERTEDGMLLTQDEKEDQTSRQVARSLRWTGAGYEQLTTEAGLAEKRKVASDAQCPVDTEAFLSQKLRKGEVTVGAHYTYRAPNFLGERLDTVELTVEAREQVALDSGTTDCFRVRQQVTGLPTASTWWLDTTGVVRRIDGDGMSQVSVPEKEAREVSQGGYVFSITIPADPELPRCTSVDRELLDVSFSGDGNLPDFPATPFSHEVSRTGKAVQVELLAHDEEPLPVKLPVEDPKLARFRERTNLLCWDDPRVTDALKEAAGDATDPPEIVRRLLRWVFVSLRKDSGSAPQPTAAEILDEREGDCSEHCVLFVTLCRAAGIPARRLTGYAQVGNLWGAHSFAEVWLGRWIGCDPTTNEFGTKARYLAFGWDDDPDSFPGVVSSRARGRMHIRTVEFSEGGRTWKTQGLKGSAREDPYSGLVLAEPPSGWNVRVAAGTGRAALRCASATADVTVMSGSGDLPCDVLRESLLQSGRRIVFAGCDALRDDEGSRGRPASIVFVPYRRRLLIVRVTAGPSGDLEAALESAAKILEPTLSSGSPPAAAPGPAASPAPHDATPDGH